MINRNTASFVLVRTAGWLAALVLCICFAASAATAQVSQRAEPVTGPGVTTIGGIVQGARVNVRSGPAVIFPAVASLGYGTRVEKGTCIGGGSARWCEVTTMDGRISGYVSARFLVENQDGPPIVDEGGGPDYLVVTGLAQTERLGVRQEPRTGAAVLATLKNGEIVRNLGCRLSGATRWCRIRSLSGVDVTGWVAARYTRESAGPPGQGGDDGGPDYYVVRGLAAGDTLNVRSQASTQSTVLAQLSQGARVRNLGCQQSGETRWCRIRTTGGVVVTGWVNGRYLREG